MGKLNTPDSTFKGNTLEEVKDIVFDSSDPQELVALDQKVESLGNPWSYKVLSFPLHLEVHNNGMQCMIGQRDGKYMIDYLSIGDRNKSIRIAKYINYILGKAYQDGYIMTVDQDESTYSHGEDVFSLSSDGKSICYGLAGMYRVDITEILGFDCFKEESGVRKLLNTLNRKIMEPTTGFSSFDPLVTENRELEHPNVFFNKSVALSYRSLPIDQGLSYELSVFTDGAVEESGTLFETYADCSDIIAMMADDNPDHAIYREGINRILREYGVEGGYKQIEHLMQTDESIFENFLEGQKTPSGRLWQDVYMDIRMLMMDRAEYTKIIEGLGEFESFVKSGKSVLGDEYALRLQTLTESEKEALLKNNVLQYPGHLLRHFLFEKKHIQWKVNDNEIVTLSDQPIEALNTNTYPILAKIFPDIDNVCVDVTTVDFDNSGLMGTYDGTGIKINTDLLSTFLELESIGLIESLSYEEYLRNTLVNEASHALFQSQYGEIDDYKKFNDASGTIVQTFHVNEFLSTASTVLQEIEESGSVDEFILDLFTGLTYLTKDDRLNNAIGIFIDMVSAEESGEGSVQHNTSEDIYFNPQDRHIDSYIFDITEYTTFFEGGKLSKRLVPQDFHLYAYFISFKIFHTIIQRDLTLSTMRERIIQERNPQNVQNMLVSLLGYLRENITEEDIKNIYHTYYSTTQYRINRLDEEMDK